MGKKIEDQLKPCPFCGGKVRLLPQSFGFTVDCVDCCIIMRIYGKLKQTVLTQWNKRYEH